METSKQNAAEYTIEILWVRAYENHTGVTHKELISGGDLYELKAQIIPTVWESMKKQGCPADCVYIEATTELNSVWLERDEAEVIFNKDGTYTVSHD